MRSISRLSASEVSGPVARMVHFVPSWFGRGCDFFANDANARLGGDGLGDAARKLDAIDGQGVAGGDGGFVGKAQESGAGAAHLLLEQPGRGVGRLALERVGADQFAEVGGLVRRREPRLTVDDGAHLVEVDLAAEARGGQRGFGAGQAAANDANPHWDLLGGQLRFAVSTLRQSLRGWAGDRSAARCRASPLTRTLRHFVQELGAHGRVEVDGRRVPVQHLPLQARATFLDGDGGHPLEQRLANAEAAKLRLDEQVFEVESGPAHPGGVVEEVEGEARRGCHPVRRSGRNRMGWRRIRRGAGRPRSRPRRPARARRWPGRE